MKITPQDALIYIMVTVSAADARMTDAELSSIGNLVHRLPVFTGFDVDAVPEISQNVAMSCSPMMMVWIVFWILPIRHCRKNFMKQPMRLLLKWLPPTCMLSRKSWHFCS